MFQVMAVEPKEYDYSLKPGGSSRKLVVTFNSKSEPLVVDLSPKWQVYKIGRNLYTCEPYAIRGSQQSYLDIKVLDPAQRKFISVVFRAKNDIIDLGISNQTLYLLTSGGTALKVHDGKAIEIEDPKENAVARWLFNRYHSHL